MPTDSGLSGWLGKYETALVQTAAELRATSAVGQYQAALGALADFESRYPDSPQIGRVLAVRIAAAMESSIRASALVTSMSATTW